MLVLDGGDIEESSVELSALSQGVAGWRLLGAAGVDAAVVGNGGLLRYGPQVLPRYAARTPRTFRVTGSDLELAHYGGLLTEDAADLEWDVSMILPEVLEAYLSR